MGTLMDDLKSFVLIQECRGLEEEFGIDFTDCFLRDRGAASMCEVKEKLRRLDVIERILMGCIQWLQILRGRLDGDICGR